MKISVAIPLYNSSKVIKMTLDSVVQQSVSPYEILLLDDGSRDDTINKLETYKSRVKVYTQTNQGVAAARNKLCEVASGDYIAFLDHDDLWHPSYLENLNRMISSYPNSVAFFTGHLNFYGYDTYEWKSGSIDQGTYVEVIDPLKFLKIVNRKSGIFGSASFMCVPKSVIKKYGNEPFCTAASGVDDGYFYRMLPLFGSVVYDQRQLVAYRIISEAQSTDKLKVGQQMVTVFEILTRKYKDIDNKELKNEIADTYASERRQYAKRLMSIKKVSEARTQLIASLNCSSNPISRIKSIGLLIFTFMPRIFQPKWPSRVRKA
jgi:glycosyltransferase involved in cell wall biosynthesis